MKQPDETVQNLHKPTRTGLWVIAIFKLVKGILMLIVGIGALSLVGRDIAALAERLVAILHADPDNRYIHWLLVKIGLIDGHRLRQISGGSFVYAAFLLTEGIGLLYQKRWAEYLTVIATALLIPLEIYEIIVHPTWTRTIILLVNAAIVLYLIFRLKRERAIEHKEAVIHK